MTVNMVKVGIRKALDCSEPPLTVIRKYSDLELFILRCSYIGGHGSYK